MAADSNVQCQDDHNVDSHNVENHIVDDSAAEKLVVVVVPLPVTLDEIVVVVVVVVVGPTGVMTSWWICRWKVRMRTK